MRSEVLETVTFSEISEVFPDSANKLEDIGGTTLALVPGNFEELFIF